jgi:hypothetical protein
VTLGGLLLDVVVPRPKPRTGRPFQLSPSERLQVEDTAGPDGRLWGTGVR